MALGAGEEHPGQVEEGIGAVGRFNLAADADGAAFVGEEFDDDIGRLGRGGRLLAGGIGAALVAGGIAAVIGAVGAPATLWLASARGVAPGAATVVPASGGGSTWAAASGPAPAVVLASTATSPIATWASAGAAIFIASLVVRVRILTGWLFEPIGHYLEVEVRRQIGHGVIE
jgi:hypothetical protein